MMRIIIDNRVEQGGGQPGNADTLALDGAGQARAAGDALVMDHDATAIEQGAPYFQGRCIKTQRSGVQDARRVIEADIVDLANEANDRSMRDLDTLGLAGRTRGVHDVGQRVARQRSQARSARGGPAFKRSDGDARHSKIQLFTVAAVIDDYEHGTGIPDDKLQALARMAAIERQVRAARLEDAENRDNRIDAAFEQQGHGGSGDHATRAQSSSHRVRTRLEFRITQLHLSMDHGNRLRRDECHRGKQAVDCVTGFAHPCRVVPVHKQALTFGRRQR